MVVRGVTPAKVVGTEFGGLLCKDRNMLSSHLWGRISWRRYENQICISGHSLAHVRKMKAMGWQEPRRQPGAAAATRLFG